MNEYGMLPPQDVEIEKELLGMCLFFPDAFVKTRDYLSVECFYKPENSLLYKAMNDLFLSGSQINLSTARTQLIKNGDLEAVGGPFILSELTDRITTVANLEGCCKIVLEKYVARELIRVNSENIQAAYASDSDALGLIEKQMNDVSAITDIISRTVKAKSVGDITDDVYKELDNRRQGKVSGDVKTHFKALDQVITAIEEGECVVMGARPGMGKTTLALQICLNNALNGIPSGFLSGEMTKKQVVKKAMFLLSKVVAFRSRRNDALNVDDMKSLFEAGLILKRIPFYVEDCAGNPISQLCSKYHKLVNKHKVKIIVADYLQRFNSDNPRDLDTARVTKVVTELNTMAKKTLCPIIIISQLNRGVEAKSPYIPSLSDLRDSGAVEQEADMVLFLWRPGYYKITTDADGKSVEGVLRVIIAKFRSGEPNQQVDLYWNDKRAMAEDITDGVSDGEEDLWSVDV